MATMNDHSGFIDSNDEKVKDSDLFFRSLFEYNPDLVFFCDTEGIIAKPNEGFCKTIGYSNEEVALNSLVQFLPSNEISIYREAFKNVLTGKIKHIYTMLTHKNGNHLSIFLTLIPAKKAEKIIGVFGIAEDITERRQTELSLKDLELTFRSIVEGAFIGVYIIEQNGIVSYGNRKFYQILGKTFTEELNFWHSVHPEDLPSLQYAFDHLVNGENGMDHSFRLIKDDGSIIDVEAHSKKVYLQNDRPTVIGAFRDVTERKRVEELNKYLAHYDSLTELPNRRLFQEKLEQELTLSKTLNQKFAVLYLDLDRFKYINDTLGHPIGDKLLKQVAIRLKKYTGENDILARLGGDEFAIVLSNIQNTHQVIEFSKTIIKAIEDPFPIHTYHLFITTSIGISIFPADGKDAETLIKNADSALYKAKERGKNTFQIHSSSMDIESYKLFTLEADLRKALDLNQFELYYQVKVAADTYQIVGAEALIRWNHPKWGIVPPNDFIPLAEETGLISELDKWLIDTACCQNKEWQNAGLPAIPVSINLSSHRFLEIDFTDGIKQSIEKSQLNPKYLEIEILESAMLANEKIVFSSLDELKKIGIRISIDDFGTGFSSLSYLKEFKGRIDTLKIDRSFINDLSKTNVDANFITKTIIQLAKYMKMEVVAEGVETTEQLDILKNYQCNIIQGYIFSEPVPSDKFAKLLQMGTMNQPEVINTNDQQVGNDRRKLFRVNLPFPLSAFMTLVQIHEKKVDLGKTKILIENLGLGGLRFLSDLRLPVNKNITLKFETEILGKTVEMVGSIVWKKEVKYEIYQYGVEFSMDESERPIFTQVLNRLSLLLRKNPVIANCSFVTTNRYQFFHNVNKKN